MTGTVEVVDNAEPRKLTVEETGMLTVEDVGMLTVEDGDIFNVEVVSNSVLTCIVPPATTKPAAVDDCSAIAPIWTVEVGAVINIPEVLVKISRAVPAVSFAGIVSKPKFRVPDTSGITISGCVKASESGL